MQRNSSSSRKYRSRRSRSAEDDHHSHQSQSEDERRREITRWEWKVQREKERAHELLKEKKILEYELNRIKKMQKPRRRSHSHSPSHSSDSNKSPNRSAQFSRPVMSKKVDSLDENISIFKGPSETTYDSHELRKIKVSIPNPLVTNSDLQRDIVDPEEVKPKRREANGSENPIFYREVFRVKKTPNLTKEDEGTKPLFHRVEMNLPGPSRTSQEGRKRDRSQSRERRMERKGSDSKSERTTHRRSRAADISRRDRSQDRYVPHRSNSHVSSHRDYRPRRRPSRERSRSEERRYPDSDAHFPNRVEWRGRKRCLERIVPVPVYYPSFQPAPVMMRPVFRSPIPANRFPMGHPRFPSRFLPPDVYRSVPFTDPSVQAFQRLR